MTLTKTQINYLETKLEREVRIRVDKLKKELGVDKCIEKVLSEKIVKGKIKLLSTKDIISLISELTDRNGYFVRLSLTDLINKDELNKIEDKREEDCLKVREYEIKLMDAKQNAMDMYVLGGVDIQTVLKEFDKIDKEMI